MIRVDRRSLIVAGRLGISALLGCLRPWLRWKAGKLELEPPSIARGQLRSLRLERLAGNRAHGASVLLSTERETARAAARAEDPIGDTDAVCGLDHVRWVGGGSGAGKTTLARGLAERFGLRVYSTDAAIGVHINRLSSGAAPLLDDFRAMGMDQRWVHRDPTTMYRTFPWFHGEGFDLVIEDLRAFSSSGVVLAEGFRLLPHLVRPHLTNPQNAIWLAPTPQIRRTAFTQRSSRESFWQRTSDPQRALTNLLERDRIFTAALAADAARNGLATLVIDGSTSIEKQIDDLAARFALIQEPDPP